MTIRAITEDLQEKGIVVIGSTAIDKIIRGNFSRFKIGGVTTYSGITYSRHGIVTKVVTNIANRDRQIIQRLQAEKIVVCNGQTPHTTHFINDVSDDQRRQKIPQRAAWIRRGQVSEHIKDVAVVHLGPLHASDIDIRAIKLLNSFKHLIILDAQGLTRSVRNTSVCPSASKQLPAFLGASQVVKANAQECESIIDFFRSDLLELMHQFNINEFIVTSGHRGGLVQTIDGAEITYPAHRIKSKKDPTGAGDVFLAAYVIDRFIKRRTVADACKYAAKIAARQIEGNHIKPEALCLEDHKKHPI